MGVVRQVLYLVFNEGYASSGGERTQRTELTAEAIRLTRMLLAASTAVPGAIPETTGLLALMLLTDARRAARERAGELIPLAEQDRSLWDAAQIAEGVVPHRAHAGHRRRSGRTRCRPRSRPCTTRR